MPTTLRIPPAPQTDLRAAPSLLAPPDPSVQEAPFDLAQRYQQAAGYIDRLCRGVPAPVRILEVGCNVVTLLGKLLDPDRVQVVRCDVIDGPAADPDFIRLEPDAPLPFVDRSFDAVVALE